MLTSPALDGLWAGIPPTNRSRLTAPRGIPGVPSNAPDELVARSAAGRIDRRAPLVAFRHRRRHPDANSERPRFASLCPTTSTVPRTRDAFHQRVPLLLASFRPGLPWAATGTLASPPEARLPTCFHAPSRRSARPAGHRLFTEAIRATCCPSVSATECPASTPANDPIFAGLAANRLPTERLPPCGRRPTELPQVRGRRAFRARRPPPRRPLASADLPQPDQPEHLLSRFRAVPRLEDVEKRRSCGVDPYRTKTPGLPGRARHPF